MGGERDRGAHRGAVVRGVGEASCPSGRQRGRRVRPAHRPPEQRPVPADDTGSQGEGPSRDGGDVPALSQLCGRGRRPGRHPVQVRPPDPNGLQPRGAVGRGGGGRRRHRLHGPLAGAAAHEEDGGRRLHGGVGRDLRAAVRAPGNVARHEAARHEAVRPRAAVEHEPREAAGDLGRHGRAVAGSAGRHHGLASRQTGGHLPRGAATQAQAHPVRGHGALWARGCHICEWQAGL
mmetsp:Transcript_41485/g.98295  ORF Transcript_41485/g.98295 Transcript_41485/m.98295 type:complete len:234 (+) Transcript_41485:1127-1828(+)